MNARWRVDCLSVCDEFTRAGRDGGEILLSKRKVSSNLCQPGFTIGPPCATAQPEARSAFITTQGKVKIKHSCPSLLLHLRHKPDLP